MCTEQKVTVGEPVRDGRLRRPRTDTDTDTDTDTEDTWLKSHCVDFGFAFAADCTWFDPRLHWFPRSRFSRVLAC